MNETARDWLGNIIEVGTRVFYSANANNEIQLGVVEQIEPKRGRYLQRIKVLRLNNKRGSGRGNSARWTFIDRLVAADITDGIYNQGFQDGAKAADELNNSGS